jgi:hypothetical protein
MKVALLALGGALIGSALTAVLLVVVVYARATPPGSEAVPRSSKADASVLQAHADLSDVLGRLDGLAARIGAIEIELRELRDQSQRVPVEAQEEPVAPNLAEFKERYGVAVRELIHQARQDQAWIDYQEKIQRIAGSVFPLDRERQGLLLSFLVRECRPLCDLQYDRDASGRDPKVLEATRVPLTQVGRKIHDAAVREFPDRADQIFLAVWAGGDIRRTEEERRALVERVLQ